MSVAAPTERMPFDPRYFRDVLGCFATGVAIITVNSKPDGRAGLTVNSFSSVSLNPPLVSWSLSSLSPSLPRFQKAEHFAVSILSSSQENLARQFARPQLDKFEGIATEPGPFDTLLVQGAVASLVCRNTFRYYGGDHVMFVGSVEQCVRAEAQPLVFCRGVFGTFISG